MTRTGNLENKSRPAAQSDLAKHLTTSQAAAYLGVSPEFLAKARVSGNGPAFARFGRKIVYRLIDLNEYVSKRVYRSTSEYPHQGGRP